VLTVLTEKYTCMNFTYYEKQNQHVHITA